ncbi:type II toxin-antitoxin system YafQ family toxin [Moraxella sp. ZY210820]|uniref:type II toxin-antitoxin system RelE/ParE family toxin n=1 Tax=unclassified Moraxella TaxID=2685852 RepID=UPI002730E42F|nr:type II toxin-antitoxin system YafQ family toxin [Moraxella sp. ZY210820]WLF84500.1 type II toxin-antitoxin system YafQ family toxin [Moraxella sp. ZY210820]
MPRSIVLSSPFKRDARKHYLELVSHAWSEVLYLLIHDLPLPAKYSDHALQGELKGFRDCHIRPDLVLIYSKYDDKLELNRLGTHSELF